MEYISTTQHEKYKDILDKIDSEYKKQESLKKQVETETNKLTAVRLTTEKDLPQNNVFKVFVKVYDSIFDLSLIFDNSTQLELQSLLKFSNCKFYVIEVNIATTFLQKFTSQKFLLHVSIKNSRLCANKSVGMYKKRIIGPFLIVVPFDTCTENATVNTSLYINEDNMWCMLRLSTVIVDISHHFTTQKLLLRNNPVFKIARLYNSKLCDTFAEPLVEYNFKCKCTTKHFFETVVKNCYHRLNPEIFSAFIDETTPATLTEFTIDGDHIVKIKLDKTQNILSIICNLYDLHSVKTYFISEMQCQQVQVEKMWLIALSNLKQYLRTERCERQLDYKDVLVLYNELQKLIYDLPV